MARAFVTLAFLLSTFSYAEENPFLSFTGFYIVEHANCNDSFAKDSISLRIEEDLGNLKIHFRSNTGLIAIPLINGFNGLGCEMKLFATNVSDIKGAMAICYAADDMSSSTRSFKIEKRSLRYYLTLTSERTDIVGGEPNHSVCTLRLIGP